MGRLASYPLYLEGDSSLLTSTPVCSKRKDCPFHSAQFQPHRNGADGRFAYTPMARFEAEPCHKLGIAFVRPNNQDFTVLEAYLEALEESG
jgi:hypothetical protein